jgi:hypothetical protein
MSGQSLQPPTASYVMDKVSKARCQVQKCLQLYFHSTIRLHGLDIFFFQVLNFLVASFGHLNDLFPFPSILDAGYPVLYLQLANVLFDE